MSGSITDIAGIKAGCWTDGEAMTGCTAIICEKGAVAGVDVRGSAPGTRETDLLRGYNAVTAVQGVMLSGGSAYGLAAAEGAMRYFEEKGLGVDVGVGVVPIVPSAVIFDLTVGSASVRPGEREGYLACKSAGDILPVGSFGAGTGATVGKAYGMEYCEKSGQGTACIELPGGVKVAALMVVNALGDVYDPDSGSIVRGARKDGQYLNCMRIANAANVSFKNTTVGVVATNARLDREQANKLASMAHDGLAMCIRPVHTNFDGDTVFALATGEYECEMLPLMIAAVRATSLAVLCAVGANA